MSNQCDQWKIINKLTRHKANDPPQINVEDFNKHWQKIFSRHNNRSTDNTNSERSCGPERDNNYHCNTILSKNFRHFMGLRIEPTCILKEVTPVEVLKIINSENNV